MTSFIETLLECSIFLIIWNTVNYFSHLIFNAKITKKGAIIANAVLFLSFWYLLIVTDIFLWYEIRLYFSVPFFYFIWHVSPILLKLSIYLILVWWISVNILSLIKKKLYERNNIKIIQYYFLINFVMIFGTFGMTFFLSYIFWIWKPHVFIL